MSDENYKQLASDTSLYPLAFILRHGQQSSHWELESWQRRERSLCHDMICILLSNLEPSQNIEEVMLKTLKRKHDHNEKVGPPSKIIKIPNEPSPGCSYKYISSDDEDDFSEPCFMPVDDDDSNDEYDPEKELLKDTQLSHYRYIVLEGMSTANDVQNYFARKWGMIGVNKIYDIIDTIEEKLIELKTTVRLPEVIEEYSKDRNTGPRDIHA